MGIQSLIIDSREPESIKALPFGGAPKLISLLEAGDFIVSCDDGATLAIERKTANDFLNSLRDERLFPQLCRLRLVTPWSYLMITGQMQPSLQDSTVLTEGRRTEWKWASVAGALLTIQEIGVNVLLVDRDDDLERAVLRLAQRERKELRIAPPRDGSIVSESLAVIASFPGVGVDRASVLLEKCGSPAEAIAFLTDDTPFGADAEHIAGIGPKIKGRVRKALGLPPEYMLDRVLKLPPDGAQWEGTDD